MHLIVVVYGRLLCGHVLLYVDVRFVCSMHMLLCYGDPGPKAFLCSAGGLL